MDGKSKRNCRFGLDFDLLPCAAPHSSFRVTAADRLKSTILALILTFTVALIPFKMLENKQASTFCLSVSFPFPFPFSIQFNLFFFGFSFFDSIDRSVGLLLRWFFCRATNIQFPLPICWLPLCVCVRVCVFFFRCWHILPMKNGILINICTHTHARTFLLCASVCTTTMWFFPTFSFWTKSETEKKNKNERIKLFIFSILLYCCCQRQCK